MNMQTLKDQVNTILSTVPGEYGFVIKTKSGTIQSNENMKMPAASIIKIPIMMEAFRQIESGELDPDERIRLTANQKVGGSGVLNSFSEDVSIPIIDLIKLMIIVSDNTASNAVLRKVGMERVNQLCEDLGCIDTWMERYFMDRQAQSQGKENTTSAMDMVTILENIEERSSRKEAMLKILENQQFKHKLAAYHIDEKLKIAHKTGELSGVEHDVSLFRYENQIVFAAVMLSQLKDNMLGQQAIAKVGRVVMEWMIEGDF